MLKEFIKEYKWFLVAIIIVLIIIIITIYYNYNVNYILDSPKYNDSMKGATYLISSHTNNYKNAQPINVRNHMPNLYPVYHMKNLNKKLMIADNIKFYNPKKSDLINIMLTNNFDPINKKNTKTVEVGGYYTDGKGKLYLLYTYPFSNSSTVDQNYAMHKGQVGETRTKINGVDIENKLIQISFDADQNKTVDINFDENGQFILPIYNPVMLNTWKLSQNNNIKVNKNAKSLAPTDKYYPVYYFEDYNDFAGTAKNVKFYIPNKNDLISLYITDNSKKYTSVYAYFTDGKKQQNGEYNLYLFEEFISECFKGIKCINNKYGMYKDQLGIAASTELLSINSDNKYVTYKGTYTDQLEADTTEVENLTNVNYFSTSRRNPNKLFTEWNINPVKLDIQMPYDADQNKTATLTFDKEGIPY